MKFIFILLILTIFSLSLTTNIKKVKTKSSGSGSWDSGFLCPEIKIGEKIGPQNVEGSGRFYPRNMERPVNNEDILGWVFKMEKNPGSNLLKIMIRIGLTKNYYIPWRWINSRFAYTNPIGYKYIEGQVTNDKNEDFRLRINLPYKTIGWYINDTQAYKIVGFIGSNRNRANNDLRGEKSKAVTDCASFISDFKSHEAASKEGSKISDLNEQLNDQVKSLNDQLKTLQNKLVGEEKIYNEAKAQKITKQEELSVLTNKLNSMNSNYVSNAEMLKEKGKKSKVSSEEIAALQKKVKSQTDIFEYQTDTLLKEAPQQEKEIKGAKSALKTYKSESVQGSLSKITPN